METKINEPLSNLTLHSDSDSDSCDDAYSIESERSDYDDDTKIIEVDKNQAVSYTDIESDDGYIIISSNTTL